MSSTSASPARVASCKGAESSSGVTLRGWLNRDEQFMCAMNPSFLGFFAHAGCIGVLQQEGLLGNLVGVAGSSAGAMAAGLLCSGKAIFLDESCTGTGDAGLVGENADAASEKTSVPVPEGERQAHGPEEVGTTASGKPQDAMRDPAGNKFLASAIAPQKKTLREDEDTASVVALRLDPLFRLLLNELQRDRIKVLDFGVGLGALRGEGFRETERKLLAPRTQFSQLQVPLACTAYDIKRWRPVVLAAGGAHVVVAAKKKQERSGGTIVSVEPRTGTGVNPDVPLAIVASACVPGLFHPAWYNKEFSHLIDGWFSGDNDGVLGLHVLAFSGAGNRSRGKNNENRGVSWSPNKRILRIVVDRRGLVWTPGENLRVGLQGLRRGLVCKRGMQKIWDTVRESCCGSRRGRRGEGIEAAAGEVQSCPHSAGYARTSPGAGNDQETCTTSPFELPPNAYLTEYLPAECEEMITVILKNPPDLWLGSDSFALFAEAITSTGAAVARALDTELVPVRHEEMLRTAQQHRKMEHLALVVDVGWNEKADKKLK
eukprot:g2990.t1